MSTVKTPAAVVAAAKAAKAATTKTSTAKAAPVKAVAAKSAAKPAAAKPTVEPKVEKKAYRLLTGIDNEQFCQRVSDALADGYVLYGSPAITYNAAQGKNIVAQAIVLKNQPKKKKKK